MAAREKQGSTHIEESGADDELEQYGVWVKVGPEDVADTETGSDDFAFADLSDEELSSVDDDFRIDDGSDVALNIGSLEDEQPLEDEPASVESAAKDDSDDLLSLDDGDLTLSLDDDTDDLDLESLDDLDDSDPIDAEPVDSEDATLSLDDIDDTEDLPSAESLLTDDEELDSIDEELKSLDLESIDQDDTQLNSIVDDDDLPGNLDDIKLDLETLDVDDYQETQGAPESAPEMVDGDPIMELQESEDTLEEADETSTEYLSGDSDSDTDQIEEMGSLDDLGDISALGELDSEPIDLEDDDLDLSGLEEDLEEISPEPVDAASALELDELESDEEDTEVVELDLSSLPLEDDDFDDLEADEIVDSESDLPELESEDGISMSLEEGFDDVAAVEDQMFGDFESMEPTPGNDRLASIETEITAIREQMREISQMHQELQAIQSQLGATAGSPNKTSAGDSVEEDDDALGFFDDEEDETIALTNDELDNIMNTAEFTEQPGQPSDAEAFGLVTEVDDTDSSPADGDSDFDFEFSDGPVQEITLDDAPEDIGTLEIDLKETDSDGLPDATEFEYNDSEIDDLAHMDIDAELSDVAELSDTSELSDAHPQTETQLPSAEDSLEDDVYDAEPLDDEPHVEQPTVLDDPSSEEPEASTVPSGFSVPENLKADLRLVLSYMDTLLESLPQEKIREFAESEHFQIYENLFDELGLRDDAEETE